ncbi:MAG TPA: ATP-binding protein [Acidimicrobiia bacterium]
MRRRLVWSLVVMTSAIYVPLLVWWMATATEPFTVNELIWSLVVVPTPVLAGVYLMWKRPENPIGELLTVSSICLFVLLTILEIPTIRAFEMSGVQDWMWAPMWLAQTFSAIGVVLIVALFVTIPTGEIRFQRERRLIALSWLTVPLPTLVLISNEFVQAHDLSFPGVKDVPSPFIVRWLEPYGSFLGAISSVGYLIILAAIVILFLRYRDTATREKKQIRWVLYGGAMAILISGAPFALGELGVVPPLQHNVVALLSSLPMLFFFASLVIAVLEPPWFDVDIVIRRSFVYGALSFVILLLYIGAAAAFGVVAAGARLDIEVAVVLTVIVAVVFQPARRRLQLVADRWVFGIRPTHYEAVAEFGETIEQSAEPAELLPRLVETIRKAVRLKWVTATLDDGTRAESGERTGTTELEVPIGIGSENVGRIECGPKLSGSIDDDEKHLVQTLAAQVGLAVMNARLAGRILNAAEAERRRIERNIHDGAQQELVALVARLGMAKTNAARGELTPEAIAELQTEAQHILSDLRELAQGIHPSVLSDGGILEAVEDRCAHVPLEVSLRAPEALRTMRFDDDVEGAAYFFVSEALANTLKHSGASRVEVTLDANGDRIQLGVTDDGCGFDPGTDRGYGLAGLGDRIRALGGTLAISSRADHGTSIQAIIPAARL